MHTPKLAQDPSFAPDSRVWIYVAERPLTDAEAAQVEDALAEFTVRWTAHNQALHASGELFLDQIIILMVDETRAGASGCSIDTSVHFLEALGHQLGVDLMDRMQFGYVDETGALRLAPREEFAGLVGDGHIAGNTPVINTLARTRRELVEKWLVPYGESWQKRLF
jgi:hypothetical protein